MKSCKNYCRIFVISWRILELLKITYNLYNSNVRKSMDLAQRFLLTVT